MLFLRSRLSCLEMESLTETQDSQTWLDWLTSKSRGLPYLCLPSTGISTCHHVQLFMGCWGLNSDPYACVLSTLLTKVSFKTLFLSPTTFVNLSFFLPTPPPPQDSDFLCIPGGLGTCFVIQAGLESWRSVQLHWEQKHVLTQPALSFVQRQNLGWSGTHKP